MCVLAFYIVVCIQRGLELLVSSIDFHGQSYPVASFCPYATSEGVLMAFIVIVSRISVIQNKNTERVPAKNSKHL